MNRVLKFRVWYPKAWTDEDQPIFAMTYDWAFEDYSPLNDLLANPGEQVTFMQFIGDTDKNGKEVYEGDIVRLKGEIHIIGFRVQSITTNGHGDCCTDTFAGFHLGFYDRSSNYFHECEVIGNIYETPKLVPNYAKKPL